MFRPTKKNRAYIPMVQKHETLSRPMEKRQRSADEYHTYRWTKASRRFREAHPLCASCLEKGKVKPSEVVDHIIPFPLCDFWDANNWQALCRECNIAKGNRDKKLFRRRRREENRGRGV